MRLARAARLFNIVMLMTDDTGWLGTSDKFDRAVADFSVAYADQSERDHKVLTKAVKDGKLKVVIERE